MVVSKEQQDYYRILGVNKGCLDNEIKKSYYKLAKKWHPDKNGSPLAEEKFKEINKAYEILSDDKKRSTYDSQYTGRSDILTRTSSYSAKTRSTYTPKSANFTFFTNTSANNDSFNMDYDAKWRAFTNANNFYDQTRTTENPFAKFTNNFKPEYNIPPFTSPKFSRESFYKVIIILEITERKKIKENIMILFSFRVLKSTLKLIILVQNLMTTLTLL